MLPKINRIKKKKDFAVIFKKGKNFKTGSLILKIAQNAIGQYRFGFIISQKVSKKAVVRNKIRRRLAEIVKKNINTKVKKEAGLDAVFIGLPGLEKKDFPEVKKITEELINKAGLL